MSNLYRKKHPVQERAKYKVKYAVRTGKIKVLPCQWPGCNHPDKFVEAHHWSYAEEYHTDVYWLCIPHHKEIHRRLISRFGEDWKRTPLRPDLQKMSISPGYHGLIGEIEL